MFKDPLIKSFWTSTTRKALMGRTICRGKSKREENVLIEKKYWIGKNAKNSVKKVNQLIRIEISNSNPIVVRSVSAVMAVVIYVNIISWHPPKWNKLTSVFYAWLNAAAVIILINCHIQAHVKSLACAESQTMCDNMKLSSKLVWSGKRMKQFWIEN